MPKPPPPLGPQQAVELLRGTPSVIRAEIDALPAAALSWHPKPGEWCISEVLGHMIVVEQTGFAGRIRMMLESTDPELVATNKAEERRDCERDARSLVAELAVLRDASVALVAALKPADLGRGGRHPGVGYLRIGDLLHEWIYHDRDHVRQILANTQQFVWGHLGNAQRFYTA